LFLLLIEHARLCVRITSAGYWFHEIPVPAPAPEPAPSADAAPFDQLTEAERYAVMYPDRAARIRAAGGLPPTPDYGPPEPELVHDIVHGSSPILRALDQPAAARPRVNPSVYSPSPAIVSPDAAMSHANAP
jgi:hypothetical protein